MERLRAARRVRETLRMVDAAREQKLQKIDFNRQLDGATVDRMMAAAGFKVDGAQ